MAHIAFLGLGIMGSGMAHNLLRQGNTLAAYNRSRAKAEPLAARGARIAESPFDAARDADVIISMVADDGASRAVWLGEHGALANARAGTLCIESGTLTPDWIRELADAAHARQCELLDAPVTGSKLQAENGELVFLVGGDETTLERARPFLLQMGKMIFHFGANGSGAMLKLINNMTAGIQIVALAEGLALAEQSGLDLNQVGEFLMQGPPGSPLVKRKMPELLAHDYAPRFALQWMHKDFSYGLNEAAQKNVPMPTIAAAREVFRLALARGWGEKDFASVYELFRPNADA
jgi:3-hydroxyisobutyrate dehydrogenase